MWANTGSKQAVRLNFPNGDGFFSACEQHRIGTGHTHYRFGRFECSVTDKFRCFNVLRAKIENVIAVIDDSRRFCVAVHTFKLRHALENKAYGNISGADNRDDLVEVCPFVSETTRLPVIFFMFGIT